METRLLPVCLASMTVAGCVTHGGVPVETGTACDRVKTDHLTDHDINVMDKQAKKDILLHNKGWLANCQQASSLHKAL